MYAATLQRLVSALASCAQPMICCKGRVSLEKPVIIYGRDDAGHALEPLLLPPSSDAAIRPLLNACVPASFGRGNEEVVDETYRKALALPTDSFATSFNLAEHSILGEVRELLMPKASRIYARLHKLNVYESGGFFKEHKDTPRADHQFGSLVVCLPVPHEGGDLLVRHNDNIQARCNWDSQADAQSNMVCWAAFYSDCQHEVEAVTSGYRVTLTYELVAEAADSIDTEAGVQVLQKAAPSYPLFTELKTALDDVTFMSEGGWLGIACSHQYAVGFGSKLHASMLKGHDAAVYAIALELELHPRLVFIFNCLSKDDNSREHCNDGINSTILMASCSGDITRGGSSSEYKTTRQVLLDAGAKPTHDVLWLNEGNMNFSNKHPFITYGNEATLDMAYSAAALLLEVFLAEEGSARSA